MSAGTGATDASKISVTATDPEQVRAFENARRAVESDVEQGTIDAERWGGDVKGGEVLRVLAEAYTGGLDTDGGPVK